MVVTAGGELASGAWVWLWAGAGACVVSEACAGADAADVVVGVGSEPAVTVIVTGTAVQSVPELASPTAAVISSAVASKTIRFLLIMQPRASFASLETITNQDLSTHSG
jgi:hypothetical protein